ncbi:hypothetical protein GPA22_08625 [Aromatoleum toluvorans]|uniref:histidine kinase n=1 Tax=Aromatoleum toluvorans TaxID=92002 RepID=A0ABX1PZW3_9RHOO|nr:HAMP domain-containing sensor histidine kinase [Aromatoleum toluvorans]NMG43794.1 hypothetical protein [Aromatoleum toluvorans]
MNLIDAFESGAIAIPWAVSIDGKYFPSSTGRDAPMHCITDCNDKYCQNPGGTLLGHQCTVGFTYYHGKVGEAIIILFGTLGSKGWESVDTGIRQKNKDDLKGRSVSARDFSSWLEKLKSLNKLFVDYKNNILSEALHPLHETPKIAEEIRNLADSLVNLKPGKTFDERFSAALPAERGIYKGAQLLVDSFDMLSIFFNPESAKLGEKRIAEPYKLIHKLVLLLSNSNNGLTRRRPKIYGESYKKYLALESFRIIPLALLNNAIKYSMTEEVIIDVRDVDNGTLFSLVSTGPYISEEECGRIFERGFRGKYAQSIDRDGMGIGLYVAREAAIANRTTIKVVSEDLGYSLKSIPMARNTFSFVVRDVV